MTFDAVNRLNWLAVVGAVAWFGLGAVWFTPMALGRQWQRSIGWDETRGQLQATAMTYAGPAVAYLVSAVVIGMIARATGTDSLGEGIVLGVLLAIGFVLPLTAADAAFDPNKPQPWTWFAITGAYHVIGILIVAVLVALWR